MICDEAHRIRENSHNRYTPKAKRSDRTQIEELFHSSKVLVFFVDDDQIVRPGEIGSSDAILDAARAHNNRVFDYTLEAQFRCNGSDGFINWVNNTLDIKRTANVIWDLSDPFDFRIINSPEELERQINARLSEGHTARMTAGFCWPWSDPLRDGTLVRDVEVGGFKRPWNAKSGRRKLAAGIPPENLWAYQAGGERQIGCIYTAQGFEFDYAGVVFGTDLIYRHGPGWKGIREESEDTVVKRSKDRFAQLVKNTYRE